MRRRLGRLVGALAFTAMAAVVVVAGATPAGAVHLFPLTPTADPLGHDCAKALKPATASAAGTVQVAGFLFRDSRTNTSTTNITAGQSVTWTWALDHCHSITLADGSGTRGAPGFMPAGQEQLVRLNGAGNDSFTMTFATAGTYAYSCVHHAAVGMTGSIVVAAASNASAAPPSPSGGSGAGAGAAPPAGGTSAGAPATLPATGPPWGALAPGVIASALALCALVVLRITRTAR